jgi:hypothetical protein
LVVYRGKYINNLFPGEYSDFFTPDTNKDNYAEIYGTEYTTRGGATGAAWGYNREDDMAFTLQVNTNSGSDRNYILSQIYRIMMEYSY